MKKISAEELKKMQHRGDQLTLVNVLPAKEFDKTRIPDARNIPLEDANFVTRVQQTAGGKNRTVVVYCASEQCPSSTKAAEQLEAAGFTNVLDFKGGATAWNEAEKGHRGERLT
jgi:rhodanese-related sulfurtransferase